MNSAFLAVWAEVKVWAYWAHVSGSNYREHFAAITPNGLVNYRLRILENIFDNILYQLSF